MTDVCVVALGKIGLPLAVRIADGGHRVRGVDLDSAVVASVNDGIPPFPNEADLPERLKAAVSSGALTATTDTTAAVAESEVVVVVVPLIVDDATRPDYSSIDSATRAVGSALRPGTLVIYETTLPVTTSRTRLTPILERASGLALGTDLFVAHSPERVFSGRIFQDLRRYPKLVGGVDAASGERAAAFYASFLEFDDRPDLGRPNGVWNLGTSDAAEMAKLAETSYRDLNIAFANQLALGADELGIDVRLVIDACNSQPFSHIHQPGISVGGHCIPVYPHLLSNSLRHISLAGRSRQVNDAMPGVATARIEAALGTLAGANVVVLGVAYRSGVKEHAFSGTFALTTELSAAGATVTVVDPLYSSDELTALGLTAHVPGDAVDAVVLHTDHPELVDLPSSQFPGVRAVFDGRAVLSEHRWPGVPVLRFGSPTRIEPVT